MQNDELFNLIQQLKLGEQIDVKDVPTLDLYMDQVIQLFEARLNHTKRYESDKLLTKTMINNYTKDKLLMPAVKKKYTKEHILLMILLYDLKQILTIADIKKLFSTIVKDDKVDSKLLEEIYVAYTSNKEDIIHSFTDETLDINAKLNEFVKDFHIDEATNINKDKVYHMMEVMILTEKANYYKRLAEQIIDTKLSE